MGTYADASTADSQVGFVIFLASIEENVERFVSWYRQFAASSLNCRLGFDHNKPSVVCCWSLIVGVRISWPVRYAQIALAACPRQNQSHADRLSPMA